MVPTRCVALPTVGCVESASLGDDVEKWLASGTDVRRLAVPVRSFLVPGLGPLLVIAVNALLPFNLGEAGLIVALVIYAFTGLILYRAVREVIWRYVTPRWRRHLETLLEREGDVDAVIVFTVPMSHFRGIPSALRERFDVTVVFYDGSNMASAAATRWPWPSSWLGPSPALFFTTRTRGNSSSTPARRSLRF